MNVREVPSGVTPKQVDGRSGRSLLENLRFKALVSYFRTSPLLRLLKNIRRYLNRTSNGSRSGMSRSNLETATRESEQWRKRDSSKSEEVPGIVSRHGRKRRR